jgi:hypothetical protein
VKTVLSWFKARPLRFIGGFLVFISFGLLVFLVMLDIVTGTSNPYMGVITYLVLPVVLVFGLALVPIDAWIQRRRHAKGGPEPLTLDMTNPVVRKVAMFFAASSMFILVSLTVASYRGVEYMDTKDFCGRVCHDVMIPEYTAYTRSSHASVPCTQCHIGPGTSWFVKAKLSGIPQVWHYTLKDYPRPLATPVKALRPSRDTCENCHNPELFYGGRSHTTIAYGQDEANTKDVETMVMKIGSGGVPGSGIHSHMYNKITYLPASDDYKEIAWVRVEHKDTGLVEEFVNTEKKGELDALRKKHEVRKMDCIDCHNRAAHDFVSYEKLVDDAMNRRKIDPTLPFIKKQIMTAVGEQNGPAEKVLTDAQMKDNAAVIDKIMGFYEKQYPEVYGKRRADIEMSLKSARDLYLTSAWPHMKVNSKTYPNWKGHNDDLGCWRCHGKMEAFIPGPRKEISQDCNLCHTDQEPAKF